MISYNDCKRSKDITELPVERFYIDDIPVCMGWYGDDEHKQEACMFLQFRKFGLVPHCAYLGKDCNEGSETVNRVLDECPLHKETSDGN